MPFANFQMNLRNLKVAKNLLLEGNRLNDIPPSLAQLEHLKHSTSMTTPSTPNSPKPTNKVLRLSKPTCAPKPNAQIILNEAKLILVGEGEVGKTCLMDALLDKPWQEHPSTHGIEIQQVKATDAETQKEITFNGWDFGGQRVYRPTHQLFFSAPAVYLVVWKPREGPQQGFVKEWIQLIKRREPSAKIIVVATHGGPGLRQPDIDRQELWDQFGKDTIVDFLFVDSKPDKKGKRKGIEDLKRAIARVAATLPEVGRSVPKSFADVRQALQAKGVPYLPLDEVLSICRAHNMDDEIARLFITLSHRLGHLTHYENDPILGDIVILRPDWLATAMSYVLDDEETRKAHGLVKLSRLGKLWNDPSRAADTRYPATLHPIFLRLMERFDLSYRVADPAAKSDSDPLSLIGQLVPDIRPDNVEDAWLPAPTMGDIQQTQICRIVDAQNGQSASAEGLFYQLIVRLHKYSLGRVNYTDSVHWQRGLVLDNAYNGRAFLEHKGNDVHITVRALYPQGFLTMLTEEVRFLVESFWEGLRCNVMVPCVEPCGANKPGSGLFDVKSLIESKKEGFPKFPCPTCNKWQDIGMLLANAPAAAQPVSADALYAEFVKVREEIYRIRPMLQQQHGEVLGGFADVSTDIQRLFSQAETNLATILQVYADEAKEGPRLFSMRPVNPKWYEWPKKLVSQKFHVMLWCEHSQLPLFVLNEEGDKRGIYELDLPYEWVAKAAPYLKALTATLSLILPVASSATKLMVPEQTYKDIEKQLALGKDAFDAVLKSSDKLTGWVEKTDAPDLPHGAVQRAEGALLREFHAFLKEKDPGFGGLVRVMNKRQEFLWVHPQFAKEY